MGTIRLTPPNAGDVRTISGRKYTGLPGQAMHVPLADALTLAQNGWTGYVPTAYGNILVTDTGPQPLWDQAQTAFVNPLTGVPV